MLLPLFRWLWLAGLVSNIGTWMQNTAAAWLMTTLTSSPVTVALVQTATNLPLFFLAIPAGAMADVFDRRRLILFTQFWMLLAASTLGILTMAGLATPALLLLLTLLLGIGAALNAPSWQAIVPELIPRPQIGAAVALNSAGFNMARAIGPALGGLAVSAAGPGMAFLLNAASFLGVIAVVFLWKRPERRSVLPAEHIMEAMCAGLRYVRYSPLLSALLVRSGAYIVCAGAVMALLPVLARRELDLGALGYGLLLGCFGGGAVAGAAVLPRIRRKVSVDRLVAGGSVVSALMLAVLGYVHVFPVSCAALVLGGAAWLAVLSSLNAAVQSVVPAWVLGRAMAVYMLIIFGGMAGGSALWGAVASLYGISEALAMAGAGLIVSLLAAIPFHINAPEGLDLRPSRHWSEPKPAVEPRPEDGPVLVTVEYRIDPETARDFIKAMHRMRYVRMRDGATRWELFTDSADPSRYLESFTAPSWIEHLRYHERVTIADRELEDFIRSFHIGEAPPRVTHYLAAQG